MLTEETILVILALVAAALLIVALLEVVWPTQGRHPRAGGRLRNTRAGRQRLDRGVNPRVAPAARGPAGWPRAAGSRGPQPPSPPGLGREAPTTPARAARVEVARTTPVAEPKVARQPRGSAPAAETVAPDAVRRPAEVARAPVAPANFIPLDECFRLFQDKRWADVIATAAPALDRSVEAPTGSETQLHEVAALWSVVGLSRQALHDEEGARAAFEEAIHAAPASDRPAYQRHLAALALTVGRKLIARAETLPETAGEERVAALRSAVLWLRQGLASAPDDANLACALERARRDLWDSYDQLATALVQRQEFHGARRLVREVLAEEDFPEDRREVFSDRLASTFSGEIGQLTAHAIRVLHDEHEREALTALQRAEGLLASVPDEALTPKRREEVNRRLWWGYTKLGVRRVESGEYEDALEPLFHALRFGEIDPERRQETHAALVRALEGVTETRVESIDRLLKSGKRDAAAQESDRLRTLLRKGMEVGLSRTDLTSALTRTRRVLERVESSS